MCSWEVVGVSVGVWLGEGGSECWCAVDKRRIDSCWMVECCDDSFFPACLLHAVLNQKFIQKELRPLMNRDTEAYLSQFQRLYLR